MKRYGLIGFPLGHSFSQKYFTQKFSVERIDARYDLFPLQSIGELPKLLEDVDNFAGFNVTIPYKQEVMAFLDDLDEQSRQIGAVNVVKISYVDGKRVLKGYNSDAYGFTESIRPMLDASHKRALVLGSGGASKAVVYSLRRLGISPVIVSRHQAEGMLTYGDLDSDIMKDYTVIVNASPVGMSPKVDTCPDIPYDMLTPVHVCFDLVYNPEETLFLHKAKEKGAAVKNGLEMLHLQAEGAWLYWNE
ncbi:MAG: shikimate dehydrogenase family protein [Marinilabiliaceae bacterium]